MFHLLHDPKLWENQASYTEYEDITKKNQVI